MSASGCVFEENFEDFIFYVNPFSFTKKYVGIFKCFINHKRLENEMKAK